MAKTWANKSGGMVWIGACVVDDVLSPISLEADAAWLTGNRPRVELALVELYIVVLILY